MSTITTPVQYLIPRYSEERDPIPMDLEERYFGVMIDHESQTRLADITRRLGLIEVLSDHRVRNAVIQERTTIAIPEPHPYMHDQDVAMATATPSDFIGQRRLLDVCQVGSALHEHPQPTTKQHAVMHTYRAMALLLALDEGLEVGGCSPQKESIRAQLMHVRARDLVSVVIPHHDHLSTFPGSEQDMANLAYVFAAIQRRVTVKDVSLIACEIMDFSPVLDGPAIRLIFDIRGRPLPIPAHWA